MDKSYIAGFFDGEGSAIVTMVRHELSDGRATYTFRPIITIAQKTEPVLEEIKNTLGYGHLDRSTKRHQAKYIINSRGNIIRFVDDIGPYTFLKTKQLKLLRELAIFKGNYGSHLYPEEALLKVLKYREEVHRLNTLTRDNIQLKHSDEKILEEYLPAQRAHFAIRSELAKKNIAGWNKKPREIIPCACGCGQTLENLDNKGRGRCYVAGHNQRGKSWVWRKNVSKI